jgi:hypothetical protein
LVPGAAIESAGGVKGLEASLGLSMREFANQKALVDYAERKGLVFVWAFGKRHGQLLSPTAVFTKRQRLLSPEQYEIVDVLTSRGVRRAMLFPKLILQAEFAANATVRQRMAIKRKQLRVKRAAKER